MSEPQQKQHVQFIRTQLLQHLNDAQFHSGEALAQTFSLSRSAISNHIKALCDLGIEIYSVKGRGYKLEKQIELLSHTVICQHFLQEQSEKVKVANLVTSTNDMLKKSATEAPIGSVYLAEAQSAGRGRRGRNWVSPFGCSLYLSMLWHFEHGYQAMSGLSLMVGVVLNNTLKEMGVTDCKLKWPNDVYYDNAKLAGILIEVEGQVGANATAIIGIGVNLNLPSNISGIDQAFTDLQTVTQQAIKRNDLAAMLINNLWKALPLFEQQGLGPFLKDWEQADLYLNRPIKLVMGTKEVNGVSKGIDMTGALLLQTEDGLKTYHGGEISVRPA